MGRKPDNTPPTEYGRWDFQFDVITNGRQIKIVSIIDEHSRVVIGDWKHDYNSYRRHSALGYLPPAVYAAACTHRGGVHAISPRPVVE